MKDSDAWLKPSEVASLLDFSARHVLTLIHKGKISATRGEDKRFLINKSELFRAYPNAHLKEQRKSPENQVLEQERLKLENAILKDAMEKNVKETEFLRTQVEMLHKQIEIFNMKEKQFLETLHSHTKLLEHKAGTPTKRHWTEIFRKK